MKNSLLLAFFLLCSALAVAQTATLTGTVKDAETGELLPFCSVFINNTTVSTATDMKGNYTLSGLEAGTVEKIDLVTAFEDELQKQEVEAKLRTIQISLAPT